MDRGGTVPSALPAHGRKTYRQSPYYSGGIGEIINLRFF